MTTKKDYRTTTHTFRVRVEWLQELKQLVNNWKKRKENNESGH
jgi:hypothetical protein